MYFRLLGALVFIVISTMNIHCNNFSMTGNVSIEFMQAGQMQNALRLPGNVVTLRITITGPGMTSMVKEFELTDQQEQDVRISDIPVGSNRVLAIEGLEADGWAAFYGESDPITIVENQITAVVIVIVSTPGADDPDGNTESFYLTINQDGAYTSDTDVHLYVQAANVAQVTFFNALPSPDLACAEYDWLPFNQDGYSWQLTSSDGEKTVYAYVRDQAGYCSRPTSDSIILDTTGPTLNSNLFAVNNNPPGINDSMHGLTGCTEANAIVYAYLDDSGVVVMDGTTASFDGSFSDLDLSDNYIDQAMDTNAGQSTYYIQSFDHLGNSSSIVPVTVDIQPPELTISINKVLIGSDQSMQIDVQTAENLSNPPQVFFSYNTTDFDQQGAFIVDGGTYSIQDAAVPDCSTDFDPSSATYHCGFNSQSNYPENIELHIVAIAADSQAQNVSRVNAASSVRFDNTAPSEVPDISGFTVYMNPKGQTDQISAMAGSVEPNATIVLFNELSAYPCNIYQELMTVQANADGSISPTDIGDNEYDSFQVRQIDQAGNDSCYIDPICFWGCGYSIELVNDTYSPSSSLTLSPEETSFKTEATFYVTMTETGPENYLGEEIISEPARLFCRLDSDAFTECDTKQIYTDLSIGGHVFEYYVIDNLDNDSVVTSYHWRIQEQLVAYDSIRFNSDDFSHKGYLVDSDGNGHFFIGGDKLYHYYETAPDVFTLEVMDDTPIKTVKAVIDNTDTIYVAYNDHNTTYVKVLSGIESIGVWNWQEQTMMAADMDDNLDGFDIALDAGEQPHVVYHHCPTGVVCYYNNKDIHNFVLYHNVYDGSSWSDPSLIDGINYVTYPRIGFDGSDMWLFYLHYETYANDEHLTFVKKGDTGWETPIVLTDANADISYRPIDPVMVMNKNGEPSITYLQGSWNSFQVTVGSTDTYYDFAAYNGMATGQRASTDDIWYIVNDNPLKIHRWDDTSSAWDATVTTLSGVYANRFAMVLADDPGTMSAANLQIGYIDSNTNEIARTTVSAGSIDSITVDPLFELGSFIVDKASDALVMIYKAEEQDALVLSRLESTSWSAPYVIESNIGEGAEYIGAVASGDDIWVAYEKPHGVYNADELFVRFGQWSGASYTWTTYGPLNTVTGNDHTIWFPKLDIMDNGNPAIVFYDNDVGSGSQNLSLTWFNGVAFEPLTVLSSSIIPADLDILGDHNGDISNGDMWVAVVDRNVSPLEYQIIKVNRAAQTPGGSCESCDSELLTTTTWSVPKVNIEIDPDDKPIIVTLEIYRPGLHQYTFEGASWSHKDIASLLQPMTYNGSTAQWEDADIWNFYNSDMNSNASIAYTADNKMHIFVMIEDNTTDNSKRYYLLSQDSESLWYAFPVSQWQQCNPCMHATSLEVNTTNELLMSWPDHYRFDIFSLNNSQL